MTTTAPTPITLRRRGKCQPLFLEDLREAKESAAYALRKVAHMQGDIAEAAHVVETEYNLTWIGHAASDGMDLCKRCLQTFGYHRELDFAFSACFSLFLISTMSFARCKTCKEILRRDGTCVTSSCDPMVARVAAGYLGRGR